MPWINSILARLAGGGRRKDHADELPSCYVCPLVSSRLPRPSPSPPCPPLQERLAASEAQVAELEYEMSDKSASLQEAGEQVAELKRHLAAAREGHDSAAAAVVAADGRAEEVAAELEAAHARAAELATQLAEAERRLEAHMGEAEARGQRVAVLEGEVEEQVGAARAAQAQADDLRAQLQALQQGVLIEKEQQVGANSMLAAAVWGQCYEVWALPGCSCCRRCCHAALACPAAAAGACRGQGAAPAAGGAGGCRGEASGEHQSRCPERYACACMPCSACILV